MKKQLGIIGITLVTVGLFLITSAVTFAQTGDSFTVPLTDPNKRCKIKVSINYGSITVKGAARKDILIKYSAAEENNRHKHSKSGESNEGLKRISGGGLDLEASENNNYVKIGSDSWSNKMNLEIEVPTNSDLHLHTYNDGDLMVTNITGDLELSNYNGRITALNISGTAVATTYNGDIKVTFDKLTEGTPLSYMTYNGDVDITFPANLKATIKVKTENGDIFSGFDVDFKSSGPVQKKDTKSGTYKIIIDEWKRGDVNGGGAEIVMKNYNGNVYIRKK